MGNKVLEQSGLCAVEHEKTTEAVIEQVQAARVWPGHDKHFAGPGTRSELVTAARKFLENAPDWGAHQDNPADILAIAIKGDWWSVEKNILGETTTWGLPVYVALVDKDTPPGSVRVIEVSLCTSGGKKSPPFVGVRVGESWMMRRADVPAGGESGNGRGLLGRMSWLALVLANVVAGLLAAEPLLQPKAAALRRLYAVLTPQRGLIGLIVVVVALLIFVRNVLCLAPFADVLPIVAALAAGLVLGKEMIMRALAGTKVGTVVAKQEGWFAALERVQVSLGIVCLTLGMLHLLVGGWWLV